MYSRGEATKRSKVCWQKTVKMKWKRGQTGQTKAACFTTRQALAQAARIPSPKILVPWDFNSSLTPFRIIGTKISFIRTKSNSVKKCASKIILLSCSTFAMQPPWLRRGITVRIKSKIACKPGENIASVSLSLEGSPDVKNYIFRYHTTHANHLVRLGDIGQKSPCKSHIEHRIQYGTRAHSENRSQAKKIWLKEQPNAGRIWL